MESITNSLASYDAFLSSEKERLSSSVSSLTREGRQDEATFDQIRLNIVTVFETVLRSDIAHTDSWETLCERYTSRFTSLPEPWRKRLEEARIHGDYQSQEVEEAKLKMVNRLWEAFERAKEEHP